MLTAIVLTKNEEKNLPGCLETLSFCDRILVIDDCSSDSTEKISRRYKAGFITHSLAGDFSAQRNFALSMAEPGWVLFVDADERVSPELATEITAAVNRKDCTGFYIPRRDFLWQSKLRNGDVGRVKIIRLAKRTAGSWKGRIHEVWDVQGRIPSLSGNLNHYPHAGVDDFLCRLNFYSSIRAGELHALGKKASVCSVVIYPLAKFMYLYIFRFGFLDGTPGFIHAMLMSFYSFLVRGKLYLLYKGIS